MNSSKNQKAEESEITDKLNQSNNSISDEIDPDLLQELYEAEARFQDYQTDLETSETESENSSEISQDDTTFLQRVKQAGSLLLGRLLPRKQVPLTLYTRKPRKPGTHVTKRPQQRDEESEESTNEEESLTSDKDSIDSTDGHESSDLSQEGGGKGVRRSTRFKGKTKPIYKETRLKLMKEVRTRREKGSATKQSRGNSQAQKRKK